MLDNLLDLFERDRNSTAEGQPPGKKRSFMDRLSGLMDGEDDPRPGDRDRRSNHDDRPDQRRQPQTKRDRFSDALEFD